MSAMTIRKRMITFFALLALIIIAAVIVWFVWNGQAEPLEVYDQISSFELEEVQTGQTYHSDNGKIKLLSFIFINCPDGVCPMTMQDYADIQEQLKEDGLFGTDVELVAITFDPERDTTEALRDYAQMFHPDPEGWKFLRGAEEDIQAVADELSYFYQVDEDGAGMHATTQYIIDADHQIRAYHKMSSTEESMDQEQILQDLNQLVREKNN